MRQRFITLLASLLLVITAMAQNDHLLLQFNFENVTGTSVKDDISGITAKTMGAARVVEMGSRHVLDLGNNQGYLNMTVNAGKIIRQLSDHTISVYYCVSRDASLSGAGHFLWAFSQLVANTEASGPYTAYRLNAQRMATSTGGWGSEVGMEVGTESGKGRWVHVLYRQSGTRGELFIDGRRVQQNTAMPVLSATFKSNPGNCWIGRPPFSADNYLRQTLVSDFRVYDKALTDAEVRALAAETVALDQDYRYGTPGDPSALSAKLEEAKAFLAGGTTDYAESAVGQLRDEIHLSELELSRARASQLLLDQRWQGLTTALTAVQKTKGFTMAAPSQGFVPEGHGFRHPGGMVTEQDFRRARQALADGDARIQRAYEILCQNPYSQSDCLTWPVWEIIRGGGSGQNYMNAARGAAIAYQNALRWKLSGDDAFAANGVRALMNWARNNRWVGGDTNKSLAAGLYGYGFAQAAEILREYEGWSREDFEEFKRYMLVTWYPTALDFLRRRHDTWANWRYNVGERPGHYWSNWGLCNALCLMSIGILCDDVHIYNQGVSFYKYDHVGTFNPDRTALAQILNDGCNEFIGNLVPVMMKDERGPFGYLGQMQESGRDQGHALMALGLAVDICQTGLSQGDDLYAYMDDRIAAGAEFLAASNFAGVDAASLPWKNYNYADCRGVMGASWLMTGVNTGGSGEFRPYWDRLIGYYEGQRGVRLQYAERASAAVCPDGGGGNYSQNSGGFDHLGFSTLTHWRPLVDKADAITPLTGDIIYKGVTYKNQTNLGGLKYTYRVEPSRAIPADGADITLVPQLPQGTEDTGLWQWESGETTRQITVHADRSHIYRVRYTAANGTTSEQSFAIAVAGDAVPDFCTPEITVDGVVLGGFPAQGGEATLLYGQSVILYLGNSSGWTDDYRWSTGATGTSVIVIPNLTEDRTYTCQYVNQGGYVNQALFRLHVIPARPFVSIGSEQADGETSILAFGGTQVTLGLTLPESAMPDEVTWSDGSHGPTLVVTVPEGAADGEQFHYTATYLGQTYDFNITAKSADFGYYGLLSADHGYTRIDNESQLAEAIDGGSYFILASDDADLLLSLRGDAPMNGNRALFYQTPADPVTDLSTVFTLEPFDGGYCLRNIDHDGLLLQTEWDAPWNFRTHDQPYGISWARFLFASTGGAWTIENGTYNGNWLGLWTPANGYADGQELACNKQGLEVGHFQLFAIPRERFHATYLSVPAGSTDNVEIDATPLILNPAFEGNSWALWTVTGTFGNQRFNGAAETWHSTGFSMQQTLTGMPAGRYTVSCQMANGEGQNTGYLFATASGQTAQAVVTQSCAGSNFDAERDKMAASANYGLLTVEATVGADGLLTFGIKEPTNGTTWLVFDNFRLTYNGSVSDAISLQMVNAKSVNAKCYDLSGREIAHPTNNHTLSKGLYIIGHRKVIVK